MQSCWGCVPPSSREQRAGNKATKAARRECCSHSHSQGRAVLSSGQAELGMEMRFPCHVTQQPRQTLLWESSMQHGLCFAQLNSEVRLIASQKVPCGNEPVKKKLRSPSHLDSDIKGYDVCLCTHSRANSLYNSHPYGLGTKVSPMALAKIPGDRHAKAPHPSCWGWTLLPFAPRHG